MTRDLGSSIANWVRKAQWNGEENQTISPDVVAHMFNTFRVYLWALLDTLGNIETSPVILKFYHKDATVSDLTDGLGMALRARSGKRTPSPQEATEMRF